MLTLLMIAGLAVAADPEFEETVKEADEVEEAEGALSAELGGSWTTGNTDFWVLAAGLDASYKWKMNQFGAKAGALAGLISAVISVGLGIAILVIRMAGGGDIPGLSPEQMEMMAEQGINAGLIFLISGTFGAVCGAAIGAGAAAAGGAVLAAVKPD
mgnify:CR=1 FL=1